MAADPRDSFSGDSSSAGARQPMSDTEAEPDYYSVLGIGAEASEDEIRRAFRRLVKLWHPDHYTQAPTELRERAERRLRAILRAYEAIGKPEARAAYTLRRRQARRQASSLQHHHARVVDSNPDRPDLRVVQREPKRSAPGAGRETSGPRADEKTFASTLGGILSLLLALGVAGQLMRTVDTFNAGLALEILLFIALVVLAAIFFIDDSSLTRAATAYFEHDPRPAYASRRIGLYTSDTPDLHEYVHVAPAGEPTAFELLVDEALASVPERFHPYLENVVVRVKDEPSEEELRRMRLRPCSLLLGLYEGVPLTWHGAHEHPPEMITIFQRPIETYCRHDPARIRRQVRATVLHELAHHFGMDHDAMPEGIR